MSTCKLSLDHSLDNLQLWFLRPLLRPLLVRLDFAIHLRRRLPSTSRCVHYQRRSPYGVHLKRPASSSRGSRRGLGSVTPLLASRCFGAGAIGFISSGRILCSFLPGSVEKFPNCSRRRLYGLS